jgi:DNA-binding NtrC family response regulator
VRERQNCIERAVILCDGDTIRPRHLSLSARSSVDAVRLDSVESDQATAAPAKDGNPFAQIDLSGTMNEAVRRVTAVVERLKLEEAFRNARGNKERAAEALQVSYKALLQKLREHGIKD